MEFISILNDVLGPVMRGPSSSHTAGSYHIGRLVRDLLGEEPVGAEFTFDPAGSYAATYRQQGVDLALAAALLGWPITDERFARALILAPRQGLRIRFKVAPLEKADHPNTVAIDLAGRAAGPFARRRARSARDGRGDGGRRASCPPRRQTRRDPEVRRNDPRAGPIFFVRKGTPLFLSAAEMVLLARRRRVSLARSRWPTKLSSWPPGSRCPWPRSGAGTVL